jgi:RND family efflux transporter MFP subunit
MNKYIVRTSLVWIALIACAAGIYIYRYVYATRALKPALTKPSGVQPLAVGSASSQGDAANQTTNSQFNEPLAPIQLTQERMQSIGLETGLVESKLIADDIRTTGAVDVNERLISYAQVRFSGYIRTVFANAIYQYVRKGDPLCTIYSPELIAAQNEYLLALRNQRLLNSSRVDGVAAGAAALTDAAERRLRQWQVSPVEIAKVRETGKSIADLEIDSPVSGYITERNAVPNLYVEPATRLYAIADLSRVWINAQIYQDDAGRLKPGDPAKITVDSYSGQTFEGRIESILPQVDTATRTIRARIDIANPGLRLKPGMFVNVDLKFNLGRRLVIPASAVLQSGNRQIAFIDRVGGRLESKEIVAGPRIGDELIVVKGLSANQRIVTSANFLIDSESQLQAAAGSYVPPPPGASATAAQPSRGAQANIEFSTNPNPPQKGNNTFRVKLTGANGSPMNGADVSAMFYMAPMPSMGMSAMNTKVTLNGGPNGVYQGTGVLPSGGPWQVTISVVKNGQSLATKQLRVNATGGM